MAESAHSAAPALRASAADSNAAKAALTSPPSSPPMPESVFESKFLRSLHERFILALDARTDTFEYWSV